MDVYEAIEKRRTIRTFKQGVSEEQLRKLLLAGVNAPSGSNVQPWEFIIIDDPKIIEQIAEHKYQQSLKMVIDEMVLNAPRIIEQICQQTLKKPLSLDRAIRQKNAYRNCTVIAVCNKKGHGIGRKPWMNIENIASTWMCIENMEEATALCDRVAIIHLGRILVIDTPEKLISRYVGNRIWEIESGNEEKDRIIKELKSRKLEFEEAGNLIQIFHLGDELARNLTNFMARPRAATLEDVFFRLTERSLTE
jgi:nitroreductase